ncbi:hypothetical protein ACLBKU_12055 [Erythrobacter sp. NE805]|uniref:hypothetical protein n=1 Tax=Erythrobacter sp. NE805 TaxID=3389875 RepID=UPI00396B1668
MAVSDLVITLAAVLEWQAPGGDVRLADGGVVRFNPGTGTVTFTAEDARFGTLAGLDVFETGIGDMVEGGTIAFVPPADAATGDWWRADLENTRLRLWLGEIDPADGVTLTNAEPVADWLVDTPSREQAAGQDVLSLAFMTRQEKLFETSQGNVCSDTFHQSIWPGERGFENCTDAQQFFAWGAEAPPSSSVGGGGSSGGGWGGGGWLTLGQQVQ